MHAIILCAQTHILANMGKIKVIKSFGELGEHAQHGLVHSMTQTYKHTIFLFEQSHNSVKLKNNQYIWLQSQKEGLANTFWSVVS